MTPERYRRLRAVLDRRQPDLTVLMENVHKPHNFSAILRTADAVGVFEAHAVNPTGGVPTFHDTSGGSEKWVYLRVHPDVEEAIAHLKGRGFTVYAANLSERAVDYREVDYTRPAVVLLGAEKWGVSARAAELADADVIIPMMGMVQSLNVSVAAAVILFEAQRQRLAAGLYDRPRLDPETYRRALFEWAYPREAEVYRRRGVPYPALDEEGRIVK
ncbi:tRNA (guanosine(18)-2'-O)-methyltransferase TrmH [Oceanithermus sp.]|uniref:tRNA (guanosine(18)-2'-O)-methyltransferase TrmH n=1 Tax=Oceanithermus sp. TaxID=2268145 RepID=UPI0026004E39|nr:tRNA (guanosine(18)-2'-O)-methyltransferase TrmH [Oceanithermus sp.]